MFGSEEDVKKRMQQMEKRHKKRQSDTCTVYEVRGIDRRYKKSYCKKE